MTSNNLKASKMYVRNSKKKIKIRTNEASSTTSANAQEEEGYIPLAARDSKWVGLNITNSESHSQSSREDNNKKEIILMELMIGDDEDECVLPLLTLFPGLKQRIAEEELMETLSDSENVTKLLVGQKPDFTHIRKSAIYIPCKLQLPSVKESSSEDMTVDEIENMSELTNLSNDKLSKHKTKKANITESLSSREVLHDETDESQPEIKKRKKLLKRAGNFKDSLAYDSESSYSGSNCNSASNKEKRAQNTNKAKHSQGSFADDEG